MKRLVWSVFAFVVVALAGAPPSHPINLHKTSTDWAATPQPAAPQFLEADREARLDEGTSFHSQAPSLVSADLLIPEQRIAQTTPREQRRNAGLPDFGPLYRRPPPAIS